MDSSSSDNFMDLDGIGEDLEAFQEDEMVQAALHRGVDLKKYGLELEVELKDAEMDSVNQYMINSPRVIDLHKQMQDCDSVLARMQEMLLGFQADLGGISEEIRYLQDESLSMSIRLKNRREVESKLRYFLENCALSADHAEAILNNLVNEDFLDAVLSVCSKLKFLLKLVDKEREEMEKEVGDGLSVELPGPVAAISLSIEDDVSIINTHAARLLLPELQKLKGKAISKAKDYFAAQFSALRKPKTNVQMLQQNALVRYASLYAVLKHENEHVAEELKSIYTESMSRTLHNIFKTYIAQLNKLDSKIASKSDLLGSLPSSNGSGIRMSLFSSTSMTTSMAASASKDSSHKALIPFSIQDRDQILEQVESEPILVHLAVSENQKYPYEVLLRSVLKHLIDAATSEFLFVLDFFKTGARDNFNHIFGKTLSMILESIENHMLQCYDSVGLLLMIHITHMQRLVMQRRRIPVLDSFFDRISMLLWPRLKNVIESHLKSIKNVNISKLGIVELGSHYLSRRYAELVTSILKLSPSNIHSETASVASTAAAAAAASSSSVGEGSLMGEEADVDEDCQNPMLIAASLGVAGGGEAMLLQDVALLRIEMISLLERLADRLSSVKEKRVFLINNLDCILFVLQERKVSNCEEVQKLEDILLQQREFYTEEELQFSFSRLTSFVIQTEQTMKDAQSGDSGSGDKRSGSSSKVKLDLDEQLVEGLVKEFASGWRIAIQSINDNVLAYFSETRNGTEILKQVMTQMLLYYTRFQDIIKKAWSKTPSFSRDIVSTSTILMEIKRFSRAF